MLAWLVRSALKQRVLVLAMAALLVVLGPMALLATSAVRSAELLAARIHGGQLVLPPPPASLVHLPVVGAAVIVSMQNYLASLGAWVTVVQGGIFVLCVLLFREGIVGVISKAIKKPL